MLTFSNPFDENSLINHDEFSIKLHSDVGFRNYLEKIYDMIIEWTRDEEAKYQASLIAKEVDHFRAESSMDKDLSQISSPRSKSSKKEKLSSSEDKKAGIILDQDPKYITETFVGHNSLKAWKIEQEKQLEEKGDPNDRSKKNKSPGKGGKESKMTKDRPLSRSPTKSAVGPHKSAGKSKTTSSRAGSTKKTSRSNSKTKEESEELKIQKANNIVNIKKNENFEMKILKI
jgi:hypothetical protein